MIKNYSLKKYGKNYKLSDHFKLGEFACKDGTDSVLVDDKLIEMLEKLRAYGGFVITVVSGYRTAAYNKKIGGANGSKHTLGQAADVKVYKDGKLINVKLISCLCQMLGFDGIGAMTTAVHVDVGNRIYRGNEAHGFGNNVNNDFFSYYKISKKEVEALKVTAAEEKSKGYNVKITASALNIRKEPNINSAKNGKLKNGETAHIVGISGEWGQLGNGKGWINLKYTKVI